MQIAGDYAGVAICGVVHIARARGEGSQIPLHTSDLGEQLAAVRRIGGSVDQVDPAAGMAQNAVAVDSASTALQGVAFTAEWTFTERTRCGKSEDGGGCQSPDDAGDKGSAFHTLVCAKPLGWTR
jgi:hypothetical protein